MLVALDPPLQVPSRALSSPNALRQTPYAAQSFELEVVREKLRFVPFYSVQDETYTTYVVSV